MQGKCSQHMGKIELGGGFLRFIQQLG